MTVKIFQGLVGISVPQPNSAEKNQETTNPAQQTEAVKTAMRAAASSTEAIVTTIRAVPKTNVGSAVVRRESDAQAVAQRVANKVRGFRSETGFTEAHEKLFVFGKGQSSRGELLS